MQDVITRVKRQFGDESGVQITDDDIMRYINDAQHEIVAHNESVLEATDTQDLVAGTNNYAFPVDLMVLRSIRFKFSDMLSYEVLKGYSLQEFDSMIRDWDGTHHGEGTPYIYTVYDNTIYIFPTPNTDSTDGLKILYSQNPTEVTLITDELSLPLIYHNAICKYCMREANVLDEDYEASAMHDVRFQEDVRRLSNREQQKGNEFYPVITVLPEDAW